MKTKCGMWDISGKRYIRCALIDAVMVSENKKLLVLCAKYLVDVKSSEGHILSEPDWDRFLKAAKRHGIGPLLYHNLAKSRTYVPPWVLKHLGEQYYLNTIRNDFFYDELGRILGALKDKRIDVIVMKGAALAETVYLDRGLRAFSDIDLLIRKKDLNRAEDVLVMLGYTLDTYAVPRDFGEKFDYHLRYTRGASIIELHWELGLRNGIYKYMKIKADTIWKDAGESRVAGNYGLIPSAEYSIILSCIHSAKHKYSRLIWLYDIRQIAQNHSIDWAYLIRSTKSGRTSKSVFYGLFFTEGLLGPILPEYVLDELRPQAIEIKLFKFFIYRDSSVILNIVKDMVLRLLLIDRQIDRLKFLATYPVESLTYLAFGSKKRTLRRIREGTVGL